jgi:hypothetical protein
MVTFSNITNKIFAIKALRELLSTSPVAPKVELAQNLNGKYEIQIDAQSPATPSLQTSKDLVEAIMRLGVREWFSNDRDFLRMTGDPWSGQKREGRQQTFSQQLGNVTLTMTKKDAHDLRVLAHADHFELSQAMEKAITSRKVDVPSTNSRYDMLQRLKNALDLKRSNGEF